MRSWEPFCSGCEGWVSSGRMPRRIHQADKRERRPMAVAAAKGTPLSVRMASGRPNWPGKKWGQS